MTKHVSLDEILTKRQDSVKLTEAGDTLVKQFKAPSSWNDDTRSAKFVMSTEEPDRYGDVVVQSGLDISEFEKNPIALLFHDNRNFGIGLWSEVKKISGKPRRTEGTLNFAPEGISDEADKAVKHVSAGLMRCVSISFMPKDWESIVVDGRWMGYRFNESELVECSLVPVPAHPSAIAKAAGGDRGVHLQTIEKVLDEWAMTPEGVIVPRAAYEREYQIIKAAAKGARSTEKLGFDLDLDVSDAEERISGLAKMAEGIRKTLADVFGTLPAAQKAALDAEMQARAAAEAEAEAEAAENAIEDEPTASEDPADASDATEKTAESDESRENPENEPEPVAETASPSEQDKAIAKAKALAMLARVKSSAAA